MAWPLPTARGWFHPARGAWFCLQSRGVTPRRKWAGPAVLPRC